jgi:tRNA (adenine37-N6)-methyltransferase
MSTFAVEPVGTVHSSRAAVEDDHWDREQVYIELDAARFEPDALAGLDSFSHAEIIFLMDRVESAKIESGARHPRNNPDWPKVGIFAQRAKNRPNRIGSTVCRVLRIEGRRLHVSGLDAVDGTPVLDIKPWVQEFAPRGALHQPAWITELMREYWTAAGS